MPSCCYGDEFGSVFTQREAEGTGARFRRKGLNGCAAVLISALRSRGVDGATVLEVGGGVGDIQVALLEAGAARATNVELSPSWEAAARSLLTARGLADRVDRRVGDFVEQADLLDAADLVVLHRVVCCYPNWRSLVGAAANKTRGLLALTFPADRWWNRLMVGIANLTFRLRGLRFRAHVHSPEAMIGLIEARSLAVAYERTGIIWQNLVVARLLTAPNPQAKNQRASS